MKLTEYRAITSNAVLIEEFAAAFERGENPVEQLFSPHIQLAVEMLRLIKGQLITEKFVADKLGITQVELRSILISLKKGNGGFRHLSSVALIDRGIQMKLKFNPPLRNRFLQSNSTAPLRESSLTST